MACNHQIRLAMMITLFTENMTFVKWCHFIGACNAIISFQGILSVAHSIDYFVVAVYLFSFFFNFSWISTGTLYNSRYSTCQIWVLLIFLLKKSVDAFESFTFLFSRKTIIFRLNEEEHFWKRDKKYAQVDGRVYHKLYTPSFTRECNAA